jgi:hypothetical protein
MARSSAVASARNYTVLAKIIDIRTELSAFVRDAAYLLSAGQTHETRVSIVPESAHLPTRTA